MPRTALDRPGPDRRRPEHIGLALHSTFRRRVLPSVAHPDKDLPAERKLERVEAMRACVGRSERVQACVGRIGGPKRVCLASAQVCVVRKPLEVLRLRDRVQEGTCVPKAFGFGDGPSTMRRYPPSGPRPSGGSLAPKPPSSRRGWVHVPGPRRVRWTWHRAPRPRGSPAAAFANR